MDVLDQPVPAREDRNRIHCFGVIDEIKITLVEEGNERIKLYVKRWSRTDVTAKERRDVEVFQGNVTALLFTLLEKGYLILQIDQKVGNHVGCHELHEIIV